MQYLLLIRTDPDADPYDAAEHRIEEWFDDLQSRGAHLAGDRIRPPEDARTVRVRGGARVVDDGPSDESSARIVGFDVVEADDLDAAVGIAAAHPMARFGRVEVRPVWPFEG